MLHADPSFVHENEKGWEMGIALEFPLLGKLHYVHIYYGNKKLRKRRDIYALYMHGEVRVPTGMEGSYLLWSFNNVCNAFHFFS